MKKKLLAALLALGGDVGCSLGPTVVGLVSNTAAGSRRPSRMPPPTATPATPIPSTFWSTPTMCPRMCWPPLNRSTAFR